MLAGEAALSKVEVFPNDINLTTARDRQSVVVQATYTDGITRDVTGQATLTFEWKGGDGRFATATGTTVWQLSVNPDLTYTAVADGVINY